MKWFRQDRPLTLEQQRNFINEDLGARSGYNGKVIEADGVRVGLCAVRDSGEFSIAILPEYQGHGFAKWTMSQLGPCWSEVFVGNPALEFYIAKCGFKVCGVAEHKYFKEGLGSFDVVRIERL